MGLPWVIRVDQINLVLKWLVVQLSIKKYGIWIDLYYVPNDKNYACLLWTLIIVILNNCVDLQYETLGGYREKLCFATTFTQSLDTILTFLIMDT